MLEGAGLGEPFGKASSANTAFVSNRLVRITSRDPWRVERWLRYPSEAWPYEALKRGLPRPFAKRRKNWGRARRFPPIDNRPELGVLVPARRPGATINTFRSERGWIVGKIHSVIQ